MDTHLTPEELGAYLIACHVHTVTTLSKCFCEWHRRLVIHRRRRSNKRLALQHWSQTTIHSSWLCWIQYIGHQRRQSIAVSHQHHSLCSKILAHWKIYVKQKRRRIQALRAINVDRNTMILAPTVATTKAASATISTPPTAPVKSSIASLKRPVIIPIATPLLIQTTPPRHPTKKDPRRKRSSRRSSRSSHSIGRRSLTAYKHAASKLVMRVFGAWAHQTVMGVQQYNRGLMTRFLLSWKIFTNINILTNEKLRIAATHNIKTILYKYFHLIRKHSLESLRLYELERMSRKFSYFRLLKGAFKCWRLSVYNRKKYDQCVIDRYYQKKYFFKLFQFTRPDILIRNKNLSTNHYIHHLKVITIKKLWLNVRQCQRNRQLTEFAVEHWKGNTIKKGTFHHFEIHLKFIFNFTF